MKPKRPNPEDILLRAIANRPDDDRPRLALARLLRQRGDPRGEFILAQCESARLRTLRGKEQSFEQLVGGLRRQSEVTEWEDQLLAAHGEEWSKPLKSLGAEGSYHRGFIDELFVDAAMFASHAEKLLQIAPTARRLTLKYSADEPCPRELARVIAALPQLSHFESLTLAGNWGDGAVQELSSSSGLSSLRRLDVSAVGIGPECARAVLASSRLGKVEEIDLDHNRLGVAGARLIGALGQLPPSLRRLGLRGTAMGDEAAAFLASAAAFAGLQMLGLEFNPVTEPGIKTLLKSDVLKNTVVVVDTEKLPKHARRTLGDQLEKRWQRQRTNFGGWLG